MDSSPPVTYHLATACDLGPHKGSKAGFRALLWKSLLRSSTSHCCSQLVAEWGHVARPAGGGTN